MRVPVWGIVGSTVLIASLRCGSATAATPAQFSGADIREIEVELIAVDASIEVVDGDQITVDGDRDVRPTVEQKTHRLIVRARGDGVLRLRIPASKTLDFRSRSGDLHLTGKLTRLTIATASGDIRARASADEMDLSTVSGDLSIEGSARVLAAETVSGDLRIEGDAEDVRARTTSGDVSLRGKLPRRLDLRTVSGETELDGPIPADAVLRIQTTSGDVRIRPQGPVGYYLEAYARSGEIRVSEAGLSRADGRLEATARGGGSTIEVHTLTGDVEVGP